LLLTLILTLGTVPSTVLAGSSISGVPVQGTYSTGTNVHGTGVHMAALPATTF
jgi:hypothetical protein